MRINIHPASRPGASRLSETMAKKSQAPAEEASAAPTETKEAASAQAAKEPKEPKKPKEPKAKAPAAPGAEGAAPAAGAADQPSKKRGKQPGVSPHRGKKLRNHLKNQVQRIVKEGPFPVKKAVGLLKSMKRAKFDETVEVHMSLGIDTTQSDQMVRGSVSLPHGIGKSVRVVVFCQGENVAKAKDAGADFAGGQDLVDKIQKENWLEFDVALATQDMMGMASRLGKVLGPRGLMPTPKAGTVVPANADIVAAVREFKAGKVEYRADKGGNVHAGVGKLSFEEAKLADNITAFIDQVKNAKPAGVKGNYIKKVTLSATMSPGVPVSV
jgi:large subunit ribosomal protein L1